MDTKIKLGALLCACLLLPGLALGQGRTSLSVVPAPAGTVYSSALAISDAGHLVGFHDNGSVSLPFVLNPDGSQVFQQMGAGFGYAAAVNSAGVSAGVSSLGGGTAMRWAANGQSQALAAQQANGINRQGHVVGSTGSAAFFWAEDTGVQSLLPLAAGRVASASAVNDQRWVVGWAGDSAGLGRPVLWLPGYAPQDLGSLGGAEGYANAINNCGDVAGVAGTAQGYRAFVWDSNSGMRSLGTLGGSYSEARGINSAAQVVGWSSDGAGASHAFIWREGAGMSNLNTLTGASFYVAAAHGINRYAQIAFSGAASATATVTQAGMLTLHPDWQGGSGRWDDGQHWNWAGTGVAAADVGRMHDVMINPGTTATVMGAAEGFARSLQVGGYQSSGHIVTFDLAGGTTQVEGEVYIASGGVLRGNGTLVSRGGYGVSLYDSRLQVDAGQRMQIVAQQFTNDALVRVQGTAFAPAQLEVTGNAYNQAGGRMQFTQADVVLSTSLSNYGQVALQDASLTVNPYGLENTSQGQLLVSFGRSTVDAQIQNDGKIIVANGAQASFYQALRNDGELRVSAGGAANFFGQVTGRGNITGSGQARFEGGLSLGNSPGWVSINPATTIGSGSRVLMELGGTTPGFGDNFHDKITFNGAVVLEGGPLQVLWWGGFAGHAGDSFDLFDWNGGLTGTFGSLSLPTLDAGLTWNVSDLYAGGTMAITAVPEPGTLALWLAGLAGLAMMISRQTRRTAAAKEPT